MRLESKAKVGFCQVRQNAPLLLTGKGDFASNSDLLGHLPIRCREIFTVEKILDRKRICQISGNIYHTCRRKICEFEVDRLLAKTFAQLAT